MRTSIQDHHFEPTQVASIIALCSHLASTQTFIARPLQATSFK
jgi:hypothetical protein